MTREHNPPNDPNRRNEPRERRPMDDARKPAKKTASEQQEPSFPEQNRKLGRRHD